VGLTTLPCKKENCLEASKKFSRILRRRLRPKLGCGAKERRKILSDTLCRNSKNHRGFFELLQKIMLGYVGFEKTLVHSKNDIS
jgi:hypothetical protein